jgi:glycosyltransferase involved in cell wall biosynthesis
MARYTFLLPAYKRKYLDITLSSIKNQVFGDYNVLISDDYSPEDIYAVCEPYLNDLRFSYRRNEKNLGQDNLVEHWNLLVNLCDTEYLIMASDDDVYSPTFLKEIDKLSCKYPKADLIHARASFINENGIAYQEDTLYHEYVNQLDYLEQIDYYNHIECIANYVFRTERLKEIGGFVAFPLAWGSDTATCNIMSKNGVANTKDILFGFRMSGLNISSQPVNNKNITRQKFQACCMYDDFMENFFLKLPYKETLQNRTTYERIIKQHSHRMAGLMMWQCVSLSPRDFYRYIKVYKKKGYIDSMFLTLKKWAVAQFKK